MESKNWDYTEPQKAPEKQKAKTNDPDAPAAGAILFENHCEECHGANAEGTRKGSGLRVKEVQDAPPGAIYWILTNGVVRKKMPVWSKLPEQQRWQLVSFIKSLSGAPTVAAPAAAIPFLRKLRRPAPCLIAFSLFSMIFLLCEVCGRQTVLPEHS
jgi:mono/diheme cytochrome c family protein